MIYPKIYLTFILFISIAGCEKNNHQESNLQPSEPSRSIENKFDKLSASTIAGKLEIKYANGNYAIFLNDNAVENIQSNGSPDIVDAFDVGDKTHVIFRITNFRAPLCDQLFFKTVRKDSTITGSSLFCAPETYTKIIEGNRVVLTFATAERNMAGIETVYYEDGSISIDRQIKPVFEGNLDELKTISTEPYQRHELEGEISDIDGQLVLRLAKPILIINDDPNPATDGLIVDSIGIDLRNYEDDKEFKRHDKINAGENGTYAIKFSCTKYGCKAYAIDRADPLYGLSSEVKDFEYIRVRAGKVILVKGLDPENPRIIQDNEIRLNQQVVMKIDEPLGINNIYGPYSLGDDEIVAISYSPGGTGNGDYEDIKFLSINKSGAFRLDDGFSCESGWHDPIITGLKLSVECTQSDGRRSKTYIFSYENGKVSSLRK